MYIKNKSSSYNKWRIFKAILVIIIAVFILMLPLKMFDTKGSIDNENLDVDAIYKESKKSEKDENNSKKINLSVYKSQREKLIENIKANATKIIQTIKNRYVYISQDKTKIVIGNNLKEVQNGFYDTSIEVLNNSKEKSLIEVRINKLWKTIESFDSDKLYEEEYVNEIIQVINLLLFQNIEELQENNFKNKIIKEYTQAKKPKQQAEENEIKFTQKMVLKKYILKFGEEKSQLLIMIKLRG